MRSGGQAEGWEGRNGKKTITNAQIATGNDQWQWGSSPREGVVNLEGTGLVSCGAAKKKDPTRLARHQMAADVNAH